MAEPFSIATASVSLGQQCAKAVISIHQFITSTKVIDHTLSGLATSIGSLSAVFQTIGETSKVAESVNPHTPTPLEKQYWQNVLQTMGDCTRTLQQLEGILAEVQREDGQLFRRARSQINFELRGKGIDFCRRQINGYCQTMNLSLHLLSLSSVWRVGAKLEMAQAIDQADANDNPIQAQQDPSDAIENPSIANGIQADAAEISKNLETLNDLVKQLMHFVRSQRNQSTAHEPNSENNNRVMTNMEKCATSAKSIIFPMDGVDVTDPDDESVEQNQNGRTWSPITSHTYGTSIPDRSSLQLDEPPIDIELQIIQCLRETADVLLRDNRYAEAKALFMRVQIRSEAKFGNQYEWKDDTIKSIALINCRLHKWSEVEEGISMPFQGRDEVLQCLTLEYSIEGKLDEAVNVLQREEMFEGRDGTVRRITEDFCRQKKWEEAVRFAQLKFIGREGSLEVVAAGFQQNGKWEQATMILRELLELQMARNPDRPPVETIHAIANAYLHQKDFMNAAEWCKDTVQRRITSVGTRHILFYHTINLRAQIARQRGDSEDADSSRRLIPEEMRNECTKWDSILEETDVRDMIPWMTLEANSLIGIEEEEFNRRLAVVGNNEYLGNTSTFQLLHVFAFQGAALSLLILLDNGVDISSTTEFGVNILHLAAAGGSEEIVQLALDRGIGIDLKVAGGKGLTPLLFAARMGHAGIVALLLERGCSVDITDNDRNSALSHAAARGHERAVLVLLENGASTAFKDPKGWTALHHASSNGHSNVVETLIRYGAEVDAVDSDGLTGLFRAVLSGHAPTALVLLQHAANPNLKSRDQGWTPLIAAVWMEHGEVVQALLEYPAGNIDLEVRIETSGKTALMVAVDKKLARIVQILISKGANVSARDNNGDSPISHARRNNYPSASIREMFDDVLGRRPRARQHGRAAGIPDRRQGMLGRIVLNLLGGGA